MRVTTASKWKNGCEVVHQDKLKSKGRKRINLEIQFTDHGKIEQNIGTEFSCEGRTIQSIVKKPALLSKQMKRNPKSMFLHMIPIW